MNICGFAACFILVIAAFFGGVQTAVWAANDLYTCTAK